MSRYYCDHCDTVKDKDYSPCSENTDSEGHTSLVCEECFYALEEEFETEIPDEVRGSIMSETKRSESWRMTTHDRNDPELLKIKARIKWVNATHKRMCIPERKRVLVRGRVPIKGSRYDWCGNIVGGLDCATRFDVYVYDRYNR